jgi:hypothetical protein
VNLWIFLSELPSVNKKATDKYVNKQGLRLLGPKSSSMRPVHHESIYDPKHPRLSGAPSHFLGGFGFQHFLRQLKIFLPLSLSSTP